jgi:hypothetical protein
MIKEPIFRKVWKYATKPVGSVFSAASAQQIALYEATAHNRSGGSVDMGILRHLRDTSWKFHRKVTAAFSDDTTALQAGTAQAVFASDNDAFYVGSLAQFNLVGMTASTAESGGTPVYTFTYWNGSSWAALTTIENISAFTATNHWIMWNTPTDWSQGGDTGEGLSTDRYYIRVMATTAPTVTPPELDDMWAGELLTFREAVSDNGTLSLSVIGPEKPLILEGGEGLFPYFGTANANNSFEAAYNNYGG